MFADGVAAGPVCRSARGRSRRSRLHREQAEALGRAGRRRAVHRVGDRASQGDDGVPHRGQDQAVPVRAGRWGVTDTWRAKLGAGASATAYSRRLAVPAEGKYAVRAFHYRAGRLVKSSALTSFDVARRVTIDSMVNGWMAPSLGNTVAPADTPLDVVFTTPSDWAAADPAKHYGAAHFIWGDFEKVERRRADLAHRRAAPRSLRLDARRDAQVGHRLAGRRPADRRRQDLTRRRPRAARTCRPTSPSATSAPPAWAATAASRSSRASSRRRASTRSSGTPTAWSPGATTGSAGWTGATTGPWSPMVLPSRVAIDSDPLDSVTGGARGHAGRHGLLRRADAVLADHPLHDGG